MATANLHKAAVLLKSLSEEQAASMLSRLEPQQAAAVTAEMSKLPDVAEPEREAVAREFATSGAKKDVRPRTPDALPFGFLHGLEAAVLLKLLGGERTQTMALVLACLPPVKAGEVIELLPPEQQLTLVCRMAAIDVPSAEVIGDLEEGLRRRLFGVSGRRSLHRGVASVVRLLNAMEPATERKLLQNLSTTAPDLLREIRCIMFGADVPLPDNTEATC